MYRAVENFSGVVTMSVGDVCEIADAFIAKDLLSAGYIEEVRPAKKESEAEPKTKKRRG